MKNLIIALVVALSFSTVSFANNTKAPAAKTADYSMSTVRVEARNLVKALNLNEAEYVLIKNIINERNEQIAKAGRKHGVVSAEYVNAVTELDAKMEAAVLSIVSKYNKQHMYLAYKQAHASGISTRN